jgi:hypothetical protein
MKGLWMAMTKTTMESLVSVLVRQQLPQAVLLLEFAIGLGRGPINWALCMRCALCVCGLRIVCVWACVCGRACAVNWPQL